MEQSSAWTTELRSEPSVSRLVRALSLSRRFHFYVVTCLAPIVAGAVLEIVQRETAAARGGAPALRRIEPYPEDRDFTRPIDPGRLVASVMGGLLEPQKPGDRAISSLDATLASPDEDRAWEKLFARMNERRNSIIGALSGELVLFLPPRLEDVFTATAPDFWSIRSGEYEVRTTPPPEEVLDMAPSYEAIPSLPEALPGPAKTSTDAAEAAIATGNEGVRRSDPGAALSAFRSARDIALGLVGKDPGRAEHIELLERAERGVGRALLLGGDVRGAEEAWSRLRLTSKSRATLPSIDARASGVVSHRSPAAAPPPTARGPEHRKAPALPPPPLEPARSPPEILVSFAPEDQALAEELRRHLQPLVWVGAARVTTLFDHVPGERWDTIVIRHFDRADLVVLLVSADYLASDTAPLEIERALGAARERGTMVLPVLVRPCLWDTTPLSQLQPLPGNRRPVVLWEHRDEAWHEVAMAIRESLDSLPSRRR